MSKPVDITSAEQFSSLISSSTIVVVDFYAVWCTPCKAIAPIYEKLSESLSRPNKITFAKVEVGHHKDIAGIYGVTATPTFLVFKDQKVVSSVKGADARGLESAVRELAAEAGNISSDGSSSGGFTTIGGESAGMWMGLNLPRGFSDVTDQVDLNGLDLLNSDTEFGSVRTLFNPSKPSAKSGREKGKGNASDTDTQPDWVESDTDEQLMLFIPFKATLKIHTLHITSLPPGRTENDDDSETPMRPKTIQVYSNRAHVLGFEEAEDIPATQAITLSSNDWDAKTGTAKVELRFVKFQNVTSLVIFVVDGDGGGERVRVDRLRIIGETGEKRELGKLEKIGDEPGE
ncbi:MAG: Thioredoxin-like protein 1 [Geoglossum simile]|nr:MAG: Thioredoxin-like protein 1 [Geoglossum simile]